MNQAISYIVNTLHEDPTSHSVIVQYYQQALGINDISVLPEPPTSIAPLSIANKLYIKFHVQVPILTNEYVTTFVSQGLLPAAEPTDPVVNINEIMYNPVGGSDNEYLELYNPNNYAVDMSGWTIDGIGYTLPGGSVLPAHGYGIVVKNDAASRAYYGGGALVFGVYSGSLSNDGETITLKRDDGSVASTVSYSTSDPWPSDANGGGKSLARNETTGCWAPSADNDGTPGATNTVDGSWNSYRFNSLFVQLSKKQLLLQLLQLQRQPRLLQQRRQVHQLQLQQFHIHLLQLHQQLLLKVHCKGLAQAEVMDRDQAIQLH